MANEYVSATALKVPLGIADTTDDVWLGAVATAASRAIDRWCGRRFFLDSTVSERYYQATDWRSIRVDDFSTTTGLVVKTDDNDDGTAEVTWAATDYEVRPRNALRGGLPWAYTDIVAVEARDFPLGERARVAVTAKWGWPAVPDEVTQAAYLLGLELFASKDAKGNVLGVSELGTTTIRANPRLALLLEPFRLPGGSRTVRVA